LSALKGRKEILSIAGYALTMVVAALVSSSLPALHSSSANIEYFVFGGFSFVVTLLLGSVASILFNISDRPYLFIIISGVLSLVGIIVLENINTQVMLNNTALFISGALIGIGNAGLFMFWVRHFSNKSIQSFATEIILGSGLAGIICLLIFMADFAFAPYLYCFSLIGSVLILMYLSSVVKNEEITNEASPQQAAKNVPAEIQKKATPLGLFKVTIKSIWKQAICVASFAFAWGSVSSIISTGTSINPLLIDYSSLGRIISAAILYVIWNNFSSVFIDIEKSYQGAFPFIVTLFVLLPFLGEGYWVFFALLLYFVFCIASMLMMITCIRVSQEEKINILLVYGIFGGVVYTFRSAGIYIGSLSNNEHELILPIAIIVVLLCVYLFFIAMAAIKNSERKENGKEKEKEKDYIVAEATKDTLSEKCVHIAEKASLSSREKEVFELIARGRSAPSISESLFVSENTVRTHSKNIYRKLQIHSKQELLDILEKSDTEKEDSKKGPTKK
jgi:DNA-binding CsgD family transcriptional regulator